MATEPSATTLPNHRNLSESSYTYWIPCLLLS